MKNTAADLTDGQIVDAYTQANEDGLGWGPGSDSMTVEQAAEAECLLNIRIFRDDRLTLYAVGENAKGHVIAIADINGPWAQDVTAWLESGGTSYYRRMRERDV